MADAANLEEKIKRLKKTLSEKREKKSGVESSVELRPFRKQLKRLQRRRRVLLAFVQRGTKVKGEKSDKESKPAPKPAVEKPAAEKEAKAGQLNS
ncbi:MAG: hypothetical protein HY203_06545 [Nitrospirae bacterium]|nr:hypothetical protein [Nitrospirota bacterium]